ncbi:histidine kinase [Limnohabitans sp. MMS-10A-160]|jgi:two-component system sensor histidine kinase TctE|uniref:sensor histidine kinase n=1 Tax=unclassified Limnohabitans TaxID=2626134 RepID=UPI000D33D808|nr:MULTISPECIES: sensor histidine kinase [unclassified Limnohabitans]PUE20561.1 histidine kinase [Limnohabitans sp. MMS-10A-192]PUE25051.1 histidine kinase [Limnohabitans sp. MMS-10A-160]
MRRVSTSLRARLLRHVILPLALTWLVGAMLALAVARYFTQQAFDRALLDDAYAVASHVRDAEDGGLTLGLSAVEMGNLLFDQNENLYFAVYQDDGRLLAGHAGLQLPVGARTVVTPFFTETPFQNRSVRAVVLERSKPANFTVVVAQTTRVQDRLFQRLLFFSLVPQLLLLIWLAWWLRRAIQKDVQPLMDLERAVAQRDVRDLTPLTISTRTLDVQKLGESINALLTRIEQSVRGQKEFAGNVAHEMRTPLAGIRALAEYGLTQSDPQVWREQLRSIAQSQERASHLIDQLLALALAQEAQQVLQPQPLALDEVVRDSLMRHLHRADALGVDLGVDFEEGLDLPLFILAQRALLEGALDNLIDNALRYGVPTDGADRHVTVAVSQPEPGAVCLSVIDNGPGITEAQRERLLRRWAQGSAGEALKQGSGLGLAIVAEYARIMGAQLSMVSPASQGQGLKVSLRFALQPSVG